jgi:hypothetical protein
MVRGSHGSLPGGYEMTLIDGDPQLHNPVARPITHLYEWDV